MLAMEILVKNPSGIKPSEYKCLVRPDKVEEKTKGGIIVPQTQRDRDQHAVTTGTLIAISPLAFGYEDDEEINADWRPRVGDRIVYGKYLGSEIEGKDGETYRLINDRDISAVLEPDNA